MGAEFLKEDIDMPKPKVTLKIKDGDACVVVKGTHAGKTGIVRDIRTSPSGAVTITVVQANGERLKTLASHVAMAGAP